MSYSSSETAAQSTILNRRTDQPHTTAARSLSLAPHGRNNEHETHASRVNDERVTDEFRLQSLKIVKFKIEGQGALISLTFTLRGLLPGTPCRGIASQEIAPRFARTDLKSEI